MSYENEQQSEIPLPHEKFLPSGIYRVRKWRDDQDPETDQPYEVIEGKNAYTNAGGQLMLNRLAGISGTAASNSTASIGVGDSTTANNPTQTDLVASANKLRKAMDATYPQLSGQSMIWQATFGTGEANFAWNEVGLFNDLTVGVMISRIQQSYGTKSGGTWQMQYIITI